MIWIVSGESEREGHREPYEGKLTVRALKSRLTRERCGGDRWARCEVGTRLPGRRCSAAQAIEAEAVDIVAGRNERAAKKHALRGAP